jgi:AcrR family transcriptional regulator
MMTDTKTKILHAAIRVFSEKGYKGATVREICQKAGAANLNSVIYYFNGKENLYRAVLEFMFEDAEKFQPPQTEIDAAEANPGKELALFILTFTRVIYVIENELDAHLASIFVKEIANPSPFLEQMVQRYLVPTHESLQVIIRKIIGKTAPDRVIRDCEDAVFGQIYYYLFARPLVVRAYPDEPEPHQRIEAIAEHITRFALGGLAAVREALEEGTLDD